MLINNYSNENCTHMFFLILKNTYAVCVYVMCTHRYTHTHIHTSQGTVIRSTGQMASQSVLIELKIISHIMDML